MKLVNFVCRIAIGFSAGLIGLTGALFGNVLLPVINTFLSVLVLNVGNVSNRLGKMTCDRICTFLLESSTLLVVADVLGVADGRKTFDVGTIFAFLKANFDGRLLMRRDGAAAAAPAAIVVVVVVVPTDVPDVVNTGLRAPEINSKHINSHAEYYYLILELSVCIKKKSASTENRTRDNWHARRWP